VTTVLAFVFRIRAQDDDGIGNSVESGSKPSPKAAEKLLRASKRAATINPMLDQEAMREL
jgi:hypothetical protein